MNDQEARSMGANFQTSPLLQFRMLMLGLLPQHKYGPRNVCGAFWGLVVVLLLASHALAATEFTVSPDGHGDYKTVTDALNAVPQTTEAQQPCIIHIKPGVYKELIYLQHEKHFVRLVGEDAAATVLTGSLHADLPGPDGKPLGTFRTPSTQIDADDFAAENITFENAAGPVGQALALRVDGDRATFRHCRFLGWQDTILLNRGRQYFADCYIAGHVDFIFGGATAFFERCCIHCLKTGYITAAATPQENPFGFVFDHCTITGETPDVKTFLGRPWRPYASVVWLNTEMAGVVRPAGWDNWRDPEREHTARYAEFQSTGPRAPAAGRVAWARPLSEAEAKSLTPQKVLGGNDGWDPARVATSQTAASGSATDAVSSAPASAATSDIHPQLPTIPERKFVLTDFGPVAEGNCTEALTKAIAACRAAGGGQVVIPAGTFVTGPVELCSNMALVLEKGAILRASDNFADYAVPAPAGGENVFNELHALVRPLLGGTRLHDVAIRGEGAIDGAGQRWWDRARAEGAAGAAAQGDSRKGAVVSSPRPRLILLSDCRQVHMQGVTLHDAPNFHVALSTCQEVLLEDLTITAPEKSPNTDGIDPGNCRNVLIRRCTIDVGDDNIAFKSNRGSPPLENVLVTDCTFRHGHGVSVGSNVGGGVRNITVQRCTFDGTVTAMRIKAARDRGGLVEHIVYRDLVVQNVTTALSINMFYFDRAGAKSDAPAPVTATTPVVRDVQIVNVRVTGTRTAGDITGLPEMPVSAVRLENVDLTATKGLTIRHAKGIKFTGSQLHIKDGPPLMVHDAEVSGMDAR